MLRIVGDINLTDGYFDVGFGIGSMLKDSKYDPFQRLERSREDCWIGNFEGVTSETSVLKGTKALQFRVDPDSLSHLTHFHYYGVANNHIMQHGENAYIRTVDVLESLGAKCFGSNKQKTQLFEHQGKLVSITGFSLRIDAFSREPLYWHNPELLDITQELELLPQNAYKIVYVHWGCEFVMQPTREQKKLAHWLIEIGFDMVVGMHPHVLQGYEVYKGKYIFYSLGNFVFDMAWLPTGYGGMINIDLSSKKPKVLPSYIKINDSYQPVSIDENDVPEFLRFSNLNKLIMCDYNDEGYHGLIKSNYKKYKKANHRDIFLKVIRHPKSGLDTVIDFIKRRM